MVEKKRMQDRGISKLNSNNRWNKNKWAKKGQVTVFIIVGILMLFAFAGIMYFTKTSTLAPLEAEEEATVTSVPAEFEPIQKYTENCLSQIGKQGLLILGQQGGYIYPDLTGKYSLSEPTEADGITIEPLNVPYWHYNSEPSSGDKVIFASHQPKLYASEDPVMSIEAQLASFVKEKIDSCLEGYSVFQPQYSFDFLEGKNGEEGKSVKVRVGDTGVNFWLTQPLEVQQGDVKTTLNTFNVKIPLRLKHYYEVADKITKAEQNYSFLEKQGLELLSVYSKLDMNYFPPTSDVTYEPFSFFSWNEVELQNKFKDVLTSYVPMLRFLGSSNFYRATFPEGEVLAQRVLDNQIIALTGAEDLEVSFDYFGWKPYFKANSAEGKIKPDSQRVAAFGILDMSYQRYDTHYDIAYPTLVTLKDNYALDGVGYNFVFALESNIRNNAPAKANETRVKVQKKITPLACNEEHRNTELLKTVVVDSFTKEPLEMVKIGFSIPEQVDCDIGITNDKGELESKYPAVYGGVASFMKEEYLSNYYPIDTYKIKDSKALIGYAVEGIQPEKVMEMHKLVWVNVSVKKKELKECVTPLTCEYTTGIGGLTLFYDDIECKAGKKQCFFNKGEGLFGQSNEPVFKFKASGSRSNLHEFYYLNKGVDLAAEEEALITLERVDNLPKAVKNDPFFATLKVNGKNTTEARLVPGVYKVSGMLILNKEVVIPQEERCNALDLDFGLYKQEDEKCQTLDEMKMEKYIAGSVQWDTPETYLTITPEELYTAQEITFYVPSQDILSTPQTITGTDKQCGATTCVPFVGCLFEACVSEDVTISARVAESTQAAGETGNLSKQPDIYPTLKPKFKIKGEK